MLDKYHKPGWQTPTGFALTHCRPCKYGWTRTSTGGGALTVCLLDHGDPVMADMKDCDRYELKPVPEA